MRFTLLACLNFIFFIGYSQGEYNTKASEKGKIKCIETYILNFKPSFHADLELKFEILSKDTVKITIRQNPFVTVFDSIVKKDGRGKINIYNVLNFGDRTIALKLVKPNFNIENYVTNNEFSLYAESLKKIEEICLVKEKKDFQIWTDGMPVYFEHANGEKKIKEKFISPSKSSSIGIELLKVLDLLEQNPNGIIERTAEMIKLYIDSKQSNFRLISEAPLFVKVIEAHCCPCQPEIEAYVSTLPNAKEIFLDVTNFGFNNNIKEKDVVCLEREFRKKYRHIRWIMNPDEEFKFHYLKYRE